MDMTNLFKACIKTVKTRNKALGLNDVDKHASVNFNRSKQPKSDFAMKAKEVLSSITKIRDFLLEHRKDYINMNHLMYDASHMTDSERDQIDSDAQMFMHTCAEVIRTLRQDARKQNVPAQVGDHRDAVVSILDSYLKAVCKIYSEQKAIRVKRAFDKQKMARLESDNKRPRLHSSTETESQKSVSLDSTTSDSSPNWKESFGEQNSSLTENVDFSPEEIQIFEKENKRLYDEMNTLVDEVRQIEGKVVEISRLQEILSEKVLQQDQDASKIAVTVMGTTENIKEANEELREAIKKNAGFRVWILFFLLVLSFSLLFLDWYNP